MSSRKISLVAHNAISHKNTPLSALDTESPAERKAREKAEQQQRATLRTAEGRRVQTFMNRRQAVIDLRQDKPDEFREKVLNEWGKSGNQALDRNETAQFLRDISEVEGVQIYDVEIEYIIMEANRSREDNLGPVEQDGQMPTYKTLIKHCIFPEQFGLALDAWLEYRNCIEEIDAILDKFDSDGDRLLDPLELGNLFRDLDRSLKPVSPDDVKAVIRQSDLTGRGEIAGINLPKAIAVWRHMLRKREIESSFWNRLQRLFSRGASVTSAS